MSDQNYQPGDYKTMALSEKIDFLHRVHTELADPGTQKIRTESAD